MDVFEADAPDVAPEPVVDLIDAGEPDTVGWECVEDEDCDDDDECTRETCDPERHECEYEELDFFLAGPDVAITDSAPYYSGRAIAMWTGSSIGVAWAEGRDNRCTEWSGGCNNQLYFKIVSLSGDDLVPDGRVMNEPARSNLIHGVWTGSEFGLAWYASDHSIVNHFSFIVMSEDGEAVTEELVLDSIEENGDDIDLTWSGSEYAAVWGEDNEIRFGRVNSAGSLLDTRSLYTHHIHPQIAWTGSSYGIAVYEYDTNQVIFSQVSPAGDALGGTTRIGDDANYGQLLEWTGSEFALAWFEDGLGFRVHDLHVGWLSPGGELTGDEEISPYDAHPRVYSLIWTGSELALSWAMFSGWGADSIGTAYLTRYSSDRTRTTPDFEVSDYFVTGALVPVLWTGSEYVLLGWDDRSGSWEVYMNRLRFCE